MEELNARSIFALGDYGGITDSMVVLPPSLEGLDDVQAREAQSEFYDHLKEAFGVITERNEGTQVFEVLAETPENAIEMWPEISLDLSRG